MNDFLAPIPGGAPIGRTPSSPDDSSHGGYRFLDGPPGARGRRRRDQGAEEPSMDASVEVRLSERTRRLMDAAERDPDRSEQTTERERP